MVPEQRAAVADSLYRGPGERTRVRAEDHVTGGGELADAPGHLQHIALIVLDPQLDVSRLQRLPGPQSGGRLPAETCKPARQGERRAHLQQPDSLASSSQRNGAVVKATPF